MDRPTSSARAQIALANRYSITLATTLIVVALALLSAASSPLAVAL